MKKNKIIICSLFACCLALPTQAKIVTPAQAENLARKYVSVGNDNMKVFKTSKTQDNEAPSFYAFNDKQGKGFVIIAGDDCVQPVLGYSHSGKIDTSNLPPAMKAWLESISTFITNERANNNGIAQSTTYKEDDSQPTVVVAPLIKTKWDQSQPYYDMTPTKKGEHCLTGCVATATAQVMNYYQWPKRGNGTANYDISGFDQNGIHVDFTQSAYDWDNMLNEYTDDGTNTPQWNAESGKAVAKLMSDVGSAIHMQYNTIANGGSGAYEQDLVTAAVYNFGYDAEIYGKRNYTMKQWVKLLEDNLNAGIPLVYGGITPPIEGGQQAGHCFVVDGYDSQNYMHVNWGWSGAGDGYYYFYTFGTNEDNNFSTEMVFVKLTPDRDGAIEWDAQAPLMLIRNYSNIYSDNVAIKDNFFTTDADKLNADLNLILAYRSWDSFKGSVTLGYKSEDTGDFIPLKSINDVELDIRDKDILKKPVRFHFDGSDITSIADGKYTLFINTQREASGLSKNGAPVSECFNDEDFSLMLIKQGNKVGIGFVNVCTPQLTVSSKVSFDKREYDISDIATLNVNVKNTTDLDYNSKIYLKIVDNNNKATATPLGDLKLFSGDEKSLTCIFPVYAAAGLKEGSYKLSLAQLVNGQLANVEGSEPVAIKVNRNDDKLPVLEATYFNIFVNDKPLTNFDNIEFKKGDELYIMFNIMNSPIIIEPDFLSMKIEGSINVEETGFTTLYTYNEENLNTVLDLDIFGFADSDWVGKTGTISVDYTPMYGTEKQKIYYQGKELNFAFKVTDVTDAINDVTVGGKAEEAYRFDAAGRSIISPVKGLNIIKMSDGTVRKEIVK